MKFILIIISLFTQVNLHAEDNKKTINQVNEEVLNAIDVAENQIQIAKAGLAVNQIDTCSKISNAILLANLAQNVTGLKELKRVQIIYKDDTIEEHLSLNVKKDINGTVTVKPASLSEILKNLTAFSDSNCKVINTKKNNDANCSTSINNSQMSIIPEKQIEIINGIKNNANNVQK